MKERERAASATPSAATPSLLASTPSSAATAPSPSAAATPMSVGAEPITAATVGKPTPLAVLAAPAPPQPEAPAAAAESDQPLVVIGSRKVPLDLVTKDDEAAMTEDEYQVWRTSTRTC